MLLARRLLCYSLPNRPICPSRKLYSTRTGHFLDDEKQPTKPPAKPWAAFFSFLNDVKPKLREENPGLKEKELVRLAGEIWRNSDLNVKRPYMDLYYKHVEKYHKELQEYRSNLTKEQIDLQDSKDAEKSDLRKKMKDLGKPKKPPGAFQIFLVSKTGSKRKTETKTQWLQRVGAEWKNLPEEQKEKYFEKERELEKAYENNLKKWLAEIMSFDDDSYAPIQNMILKKVKKCVKDIDKKDRLEIMKKPREPKISKKNELVLDMVEHFK